MFKLVEITIYRRINYRAIDIDRAMTGVVTF